MFGSSRVASRILLVVSVAAISACVDRPSPTEPRSAPQRPQSILVSGPGAGYSELAVGQDFTCGLRSDGVVECWGLSTAGSAPATKTAQVGTFTSISAGDTHACGLRSDGDVECWGQNFYQQAPALRHAASSPYTQVSAGPFDTCALRADGVVECWSTGLGVQIPVRSSATGAFTQISTGTGHVCALRTDGVIECWGDNFSDEAPPIRSAASGFYVQVSIGIDHACAVRSDARAECWGSTMPFNQGAVPDSLSNTAFGAVNAASGTTCALRTDGVAKCWGNNSDGQSPATRAASVGSYAEVKGNYYHACGLRNDGVAECWGRNDNGQAPATRVAQSPPYSMHMYPTATFGSTPSSVPAGTAFTLSLTNGQIPGWTGPVTLKYAFDCGDGIGYRPFGKSNSISCLTTTAGTRAVKGKLADQSGDATEYTGSVVVTGGVAPALSIDANAPFNRSTGQVTVNGTATCAAGAQINVGVTLTQQQGKGKNTFTVTGAGNGKTTCAGNGTASWSAIVTADTPSGSKFVAGSATAVASATGMTSANRSVTVK